MDDGVGLKSSLKDVPPGNWGQIGVAKTKVKEKQNEKKMENYLNNFPKYHAILSSAVFQDKLFGIFMEVNFQKNFEKRSYLNGTSGNL